MVMTTLYKVAVAPVAGSARRPEARAAESNR